MQNGFTSVGASVASPKFRMGSPGALPKLNDPPSTTARPFGHDPGVVVATTAFSGGVGGVDVVVALSGGFVVALSGGFVVALSGGLVALSTTTGCVSST